MFHSFPQNWLDFGDILLKTVHVLLDNKIACNLKTTGQILMQFYTEMCHNIS